MLWPSANVASFLQLQPLFDQLPVDHSTDPVRSFMTRHGAIMAAESKSMRMQRSDGVRTSSALTITWKMPPMADADSQSTSLVGDAAVGVRARRGSNANRKEPQIRAKRTQQAAHTTNQPEHTQQP